MQCQTAARGGWRRSSACGTPQPAARAVIAVTEYTGRKDRANLLFLLLEVQEECRERHKSRIETDASPGSRVIGVCWSPEQPEFFWGWSSSPQLSVLLTKERGI